MTKITEKQAGSLAEALLEDVLKYCRELAEAEKKKEAAENVKTDR